MNATTKLETVIVNAEKDMYCPISSQAPQECGEGSTTNANSPDRTMRQHECGAAKICSKCKTLKMEFHKNAVWCKQCVKEYDRFIYAKNRDEILANKKVYAKKNRQAIREKNKSWAEKNKAYISEYQKTYRSKNKIEISEKKKLDYIEKREKILKQKREYHIQNKDRIIATKRQKRLNPEVLAMHNYRQSMRRAVIKRASPIWAEREKIKDFYLLAQIRTNETGEKYSVDHIYPLQGKYVSGLHVPENLRVIKHSENCRKSNKIIAEDIV